MRILQAINKTGLSEIKPSIGALSVKMKLDRKTVLECKPEMPMLEISFEFSN